MSDKNNETGVLVFFGGVIAVTAIGVAALKAMQRAFEQLSATFNAFTHTVESFLPMMLKILEMVALVGSIGACAVAAIYFTAKYVQLVRRAIELERRLEDELDLRLEQFEERVIKEHNDEVRWLREKTSGIAQRLADLEKPPTPSVPTSAAHGQSDQEIAAPPNGASEEKPIQASVESQTTQDTRIMTIEPPTVSQPY